MCGILVRDRKLLMVCHKPFGPAGELWIPPGGGLEFGESLHHCLAREFEEETGLGIQVGELLFVNEVRHGPLHSVELFFEVKAYQGTLQCGFDPELSSDNQIIRETAWISEKKINEMPLEILHNVFKYLKNKEGLISFESLLRIDAKYIS